MAACSCSLGTLFAVIFQLDGHFITPRIVSDSVGLSPLMVIVAILVGNELHGILGMFLAVPVAAIIRVVVLAMLPPRRRRRARRRRRSGRATRGSRRRDGASRAHASRGAAARRRHRRADGSGCQSSRRRHGAVGDPLRAPARAAARARRRGGARSAGTFVVAGPRGGIGRRSKPAKYLPLIRAVCGELADVVTGVVQEGGVPLVLGGDHSIAIGTLAGLARARGRAPGVIWIDAHGDINTRRRPRRPGTCTACRSRSACSMARSFPSARC